MNTLNVSTRVVKPNIVVNNSCECENPSNGNLEISYNFVIHFDFEQVINRQGKQVWQFNYVCINEPLSYEVILSTLIKSRYDDEKALAIMLNYNNPYDPEDKQREHRDEYDKLQQWRAKSKQIAKEAYEHAVVNNFPIV